MSTVHGDHAVVKTWKAAVCFFATSQSFNLACETAFPKASRAHARAKNAAAAYAATLVALNVAPSWISSPNVPLSMLSRMLSKEAFGTGASLEKAESALSFPVFCASSSVILSTWLSRPGMLSSGYRAWFQRQDQHSAHERGQFWSGNSACSVIHPWTDSCVAHFLWHIKASVPASIRTAAMVLALRAAFAAAGGRLRNASDAVRLVTGAARTALFVCLLGSGGWANLCAANKLFGPAAVRDRMIWLLWPAGLSLALESSSQRRSLMHFVMGEMGAIAFNVASQKKPGSNESERVAFVKKQLLALVVALHFVMPRSSPSRHAMTILGMN